MQESAVSLSLGTPEDELNGHPVIQHLIDVSDEFYFDYWKDNTTGTHYCKVVFTCEEREMAIESTRFFNHFTDMDEYFINEIMWIYNRVTAN